MSITIRRGALVVVVVSVLLTPAPALGAGPGSAPAVSADAAVLWDPADQTVLHGDNEQTALPPASTTKIMTTLLALEAGVHAETVTVSDAAAVIGQSPGAATLRLTAGEQVPGASLLAAVMLESSNDAAVAVAEHVAGDEATFVERMNVRARDLGLADTRYVNTTGLTDDLEHHASALDLARLAEVAMTDEDFAEWAGAPRLEVDGLDRPLTSRNELLGSYPGATGIKTGRTNLAGMCLVASATRDGRTLYAVVLGSDDSFADAAALLDHGFDDYARPMPVAAGESAGVYRWGGASVDLVAGSDLARTVPAAATPRLRIRLAPAAPLPVAAGARLGTAELLVDGGVVADTPLEAGAAVDAPEPRSQAARVGGALADTVRAFARVDAAQQDRPLPID